MKRLGQKHDTARYSFLKSTDSRRRATKQPFDRQEYDKPQSGDTV